MYELLHVGQIVGVEPSGLRCEVERFLGAGGQGEVYQARLEGNSVALKWYHRETATPQQRHALEMLIRKGPPNDRFLWPIGLVTSPEIAGFGYLMRLRPASYKGIVDLLKRRIDPSFRALSRAGMNLADSFLQIHTQGLCYGDISFGNVFFDPVSGDVLICDNDNVIEDGMSPAVLGTPGFMAPELVRGEAQPTSRTDLFSLAVLLFYMYMGGHPLDGKKEAAIRCLDLPARRKLYGEEPVFVYDPGDESNRPAPGYHDNVIASWPVYPRFFRDMFVRSFTGGLCDPLHSRVRESEWRAALSRLHDSIVYCGGCDAENFYDEEISKIAGDDSTPCWSCLRPVPRRPLRIHVGRNVVVLAHDAMLYPHHVDPQRSYDFLKAVAEVSRHPNDPKVWGLKNLSNEKWTATLPDGSIKEVAAGRSVKMTDGTRVNFGKVEGTIQA